MKSMPPLLKKSDLILIPVILSVALLLWWALLPGNAGSTAVVRINGAMDRQLSLSADREIALENNGYHLTLSVENGGVAVIHSDCPDGICRNTGRIRKTGQTVVCLPAAVSVTVEGDDAPDGITF